MPMGSTEARTPPKSEKTSSPVQEQGQPANIHHAYPDWAAIQAYYGHGVGLPPPYFGSAVASGHAPHPYMWGPQPMMPPYGTPFAAIYPHGGVYTHPSVPIGSHAHCHGITSSGTTDNVVASPLSMETPAKSSGNKDQGFVKKLKGLNGLAVAAGNRNAENATEGAASAISQSTEYGTEGSTDGSDGDTAQIGNQTQRKSSCEDMAVKAKDGSVDSQDTAHGGEANGYSIRTTGVAMAASSVAGKPVGTMPLPSMALGEFRGSTGAKTKSSAVGIPAATNVMVPARDGVSSETWVQDEREIKRERRKQSNRESARRSRLRKQAETEELATKVESLNVENMSLKTEIHRIAENLEKLRRENSALKVKLKNTELGQGGEGNIEKIKAQGGRPMAIENLLARVNNSSSMNRSMKWESDTHENSSGKLHQLMESNSRADAVAAG